MFTKQAFNMWTDIIWYKGCVPKQAFNMWTAQLERLPTKTRIASWGLNMSLSCDICLIGTETRDHVLLQCGFAAEIWRAVFSKLDPTQSLITSWAELLSWIRRSSEQAPSLLRKVVVQSVVYNIWRQRNNMTHNHTFVPARTTFKLIDREVRNILFARRKKKRFKNLLIRWLA